MRSPGILPLICGSSLTLSSVLLAGQLSPGDLCTGSVASGTGLRGAYYTASAAAGPPSLVRIDPRIESATIRNLPKALAPKAPAVVRWCGWIRPVMSGPHRFHSAAGTMRMEIDKRPVSTTSAGGRAVDLQAGKAYAIWIELQDAAAAGEFSLQWTPPFGATYDVPPTVLFPPVETLRPGC